MKFFIKIIILQLLVFGFLSCKDSSANNEIKKIVKNVNGTVVMSFDFSKYKNREELKLWLPYPVSNEFQDISMIRVEGNFSFKKIYKDNTYKFPIFLAKWNKNIEERKLTFSFTLKRREVAKRNLVEKKISKLKNKSFYLQPTKFGPIDGEVKKLSDKITKGKTTVLGKSKAIYDWVCGNMYREPKTLGCGSGNVCSLLKTRGGKCVDISSVFISLARSAGIPSREIFGIRLGKKSIQDITTWYHCWAEFYLPGTGWVSVDPGDVRKMMLKKNLKEKSTGAEHFKNYFWGGIDPFRVELSTGRDIALFQSYKEKKINYLMYPYAQIGEKTINWLDPVNFSYNVKFKKQI